ncbi:hypothetical protein QVD17_20054 [Tagetes erecta]|uniref:Lipoxygenase domain-containing protein n=1 Tax=Tagetes erecta TaxID=13708 RepID=A0AAD8KNW4_TARER|nr:hypothetical protein QVD17_20054 [Tagetes erecta]
MAAMKNMISSFYFSHEVKNTLNTNPISTVTQKEIAYYLERATSKVPMTSFLSSSKRKSKSLKVVKATLALDFVDEQVKVKLSSVLKVTATVTINKVNNEVSMMKIPWLYPQNDMKREEEGVGFQLVSTQLDPSTMKPKVSKECVIDWYKCTTRKGHGTGCFSFEVELVIDANFGEPGAILIRNNYDKELYVETISLDSFFHFSCNSWIQPAHISNEQRIFFSNKAYLPSETPKGLKYLRAKELKNKRGDGTGERLASDRIYDYDTYNDLGNPDKGAEFARPTLGGEQYPCPRRCRTGRPSSITDETTEIPVNTMISSTYVPRDEAMEGTRRNDIHMGILKGVLHNIPSMVSTLYNEKDACRDFAELYRNTQHEVDNMHGLLKFLDIRGSIEEIFKFETPKHLSWNAASYEQDDYELGRQTLAGMNPVSLERLKVYPPVSKLDPSIYGQQDSELKEEHIIWHLDGMSVQQALDENKLFVLDYHDIYLPFLERINSQEDRKGYATRTIFFLTKVGTLKPIAIELSLPPNDNNVPSKQVLTPPVDATTNWLWKLGKAHVCSNDNGAHQLIHHWLRVHACMEPFIIATHRHLSSLHPIFKLLSVHMKHALAINAMARENLISADGIIECGFSPGKYSIEMVSAAYRDWWRFDLEALPADLIRRGMAVPDETKPHGLRLLIEDYPYANDGLLIWSAIQDLVQTYVNHYYLDENVILYDSELQSWYSEAINVGHADLREENWWPKLTTPAALIEILTILIWTASAQHAALNFGQYHYGGYVPNRPPLMQKLIPQQHDDEYQNFMADPQAFFLASLPSLFDSTKYMAVIDIISAHSHEEEYIGEMKDVYTRWSGEPEIINAFYRFSLTVKKIENEIHRRNEDPKLRNRCGAGVLPYELLVPTSEPGVTGRGVPNNISI